MIWIEFYFIFLLGMYNDKIYRKRVEECIDCLVGKYCEGEGNDYLINDCLVGFYCINWVDNSFFNDGVIGIICFKGWGVFWY